MMFIMTRTFPLALAVLLAAAPVAAQDLKSPPSPTDEVESLKGDLDDPPDQDQEAAPAGVDDQAKELYQAGRKAFNVGDFAEAVDKFKAAYKLSEKPALLYNLAFAHDKAGQRKEAIFFYERYLAEDSSAPEERQGEVNARIKALKKEQATAATAKKVIKKAAKPAPVKAAPKTVKTPLYKKWWLWTIVGVVVVGGVATGVVLGTRDKHTNVPPTELGTVTGKLGVSWR